MIQYFTGRSSCLALAASLFLNSDVALSQTVIDFESLLPPTTEFNNGDPIGNSGPSPLFAGTSAPIDPTDPGAGTVYSQSATIGAAGASASFLNEFSVTPTFRSWSGFALSNVVDRTTPGFTNQYAAFPGGGADSASGAVVPGSSYAIAFTGSDVDPATNQPTTMSLFNLNQDSRLSSIDVANTTYVERYARAGLDGFDAAFGATSDPVADFNAGQQFDSGDFFKLIVTGFSGENATGLQTGIVEWDLIDFDGGVFQDDWQTLDLTGFGVSRSLTFATASGQISDFGAFGTFSDVPNYVAIDNVVFAAVPEPSAALVLFGIIGCGGVLRRRSIE